MSDTAAIADLLHEAAETHHIVYRIVDGDDPDWASWYADWLLDHSELPNVLAVHDDEVVPRPQTVEVVERRGHDRVALPLGAPIRTA